MNSALMKHALAAAAVALASISLPVSAWAGEPRKDIEVITEDELQLKGAIDVGPALSLYRPDLFTSVDGSVLIHSLPVTTFLDGRRFPISSDLGRMGMAPLDIFPLAFFRAVEVQKVGTSPIYASDGPGGAVDLRLKRISAGGEIGVFYGRSDGKYEREDFQTYIIGGVGNDKVQITAGAAYRESSGSIPYRDRRGTVAPR
jgi:outer membrane receptor protein involved in Fe transport